MIEARIAKLPGYVEVCPEPLCTLHNSELVIALHLTCATSQKG